MTVARRHFLDTLHRSLVWALIIAIVAGVGASAWVIVFTDMRQDTERVVWSAIVAPLGLAGLLSAVSVARRRQLVVAMTICVAFTAVGSTALLLVLGDDRLYGSQPGTHLAAIGGMALALGIAMAHSGVFLALVPTQAIVLTAFKWIAMVCMWGLAGCICLVVGLENKLLSGSNINVFFLLLSLMLFLSLGSLLGSIVVGIAAMSQANRRRHDHQSLSSHVKMSMACPRCGERQTLASGAAQCAKCRARMLIEVEEPRCDCGYLLYRLRGDSCPECGRAISERQQWGGAGRQRQAPAEV